MFSNLFFLSRTPQYLDNTQDFEGQSRSFLKVDWIDQIEKNKESCRWFTELKLKAQKKLRARKCW
jgi:hypothetical protein